MQNSISEILSHFPEKVSQDILDYTTNVALIDSRYIFVSRNKITRQQYGYCTHCKKTSKTENLKHNEKTVCVNCGSKCVIKSSGRGRKFLFDQAYFVWYEKSTKSENAITARGLYVTRDYSGDYHKVETNFRVTSVYLFEPGNSIMLERYFWSDGKWRIRKSVISEAENAMQNIKCSYSRDNIATAVKGTIFQYSTWEQYNHGNMLKFFDLVSKYPCIEYLTKLGLNDIVLSKLQGRKTYNAVYWRGKTLNKVLRMDKAELNKLRKLKLSLKPFSLYIHQQSKKDGSNLDIYESYLLSNMIQEYSHDCLEEVRKYANFRKIIGYLKKQYIRKNTAKKHYRTYTEVLNAWKDYLRDCKVLEMDLNCESVIYPTYLYDAHKKTINKVKMKVDESLNTLIADRLKQLEKYQFEQFGFMIRPAKNSIEIFEEGKALRHCVGSYTKDYANGRTNIFFIRKIIDLDKPFYTVEISGNQIVQVYGYKNTHPTKDVEEFIESFTSVKLSNKKHPNIKRNTRFQEVAV